MNFIKTHIKDVIICEPKVFSDDRGYFMESFRKDLFEKFIGYKVNFCQDNESKSTKGILRGLHYQIGDSAQAKLVRVISGEVLDVAVDIRKGSPTFGKYVAVELNDKNKKQLFVPRGFAHGFLVLSEEAVFSYKVDNYYDANADRGIAFDDLDLNIDWAFDKKEIRLSKKDQELPRLSDAECFNYHVE